MVLVEQFKPTDDLPFLSASMQMDQHYAIGTQMFSQATSCTSCLQALLQVSVKDKKGKNSKSKQADTSSAPQETVPASFYILSFQQMLENDYPQLSACEEQGFVKTLPVPLPAAPPPPASGPAAAAQENPDMDAEGMLAQQGRALLGIDCEMCRTTAGIRMPVRSHQQSFIILGSVSCVVIGILNS
jgi:hypothetical protein